MEPADDTALGADFIRKVTNYGAFISSIDGFSPEAEDFSNIVR